MQSGKRLWTEGVVIVVVFFLLPCVGGFGSWVWPENRVANKTTDNLQGRESDGWAEGMEGEKEKGVVGRRRGFNVGDNSLER